MPTLYDIAKISSAEIEEYQKQGGIDLIGITTGFKDIDYALGGFRNDAYYSIGGSSGKGKSALALSMALAQARAGHKVWYASLEMSSSMLAIRFISAYTGIPSLLLERGRITDDQMKKVNAAVEDLAELEIQLDDESLTTTELEQALYDHTQKRDIDIVYADYSSLFKDNPGVSPFERESIVSGNLRALARKMDKPVVCLVQLNRNSLQRENSKPVLSDIKNSGQHEQDSQAVMFIHRPYVAQMMSEGLEPIAEEDAEIIVAKNRSGPAGITVDVVFEPKKMLWRDKSYEIVPPPRIMN